jgi:hypothetical protein
MGETDLDQFYRFLINRSVNLSFLYFDFFEKIVYRLHYRFTGLIGLPILVDFNHCRPTVDRTGLPILDFSNAKFEFGVGFDRVYLFSW